MEVIHEPIKIIPGDHTYWLPNNSTPCHERREGTSSVVFEVLIMNCKIKYKFVDLQLFSVKHKFVHLQLFDVKFLFSEKYIFHKQKRITVYGRASLFSNSKITWKNDDLLSSKHK